MITPPVKPESYRTKEMKILARWILAGESGSVVGLAGCGRSNFLDFLCDRPEVLASYLPDKVRPIALISVDLNHLPANDPSTLYRVLLRSFYWEREHFEQHIRDRIIALYQENRTTQDPFVSQSALHEILFAFRAQQTQVVLILNRFDRFCHQSQTNPQMIYTLRGLRDSFKQNLCFIAGMRQEVAYLADPKALGDMYELLESTCWVGPMVDEDAQYVMEQVLYINDTQPTELERAKMHALTGNFPALVKAMANWWLESEQSIKEWPDPDTLVVEHRFKYRLTRLWNGLTQEEQFALSAVQTWQESKKALGRKAKDKKKKSNLKKELKKLEEDHGGILKRLVKKGVCDKIDAEWHIRGELLAAYIKNVGPYSRGRIRLDSQTEEIYQGLTSLRDQLSPLEDKLLRYLIKYPKKLHPYSELIQAVWSEERSRNELFGLIKILREKIEMTPSDPRYIINKKGNPEGSYQLYPEGRPDH